MKFKITHVVEANSRDEAITDFLSRNSNIDKDTKVTAEPLCPKGMDKKGSCYEMCAYRDNGMCNIDFEC